MRNEWNAIPGIMYVGSAIGTDQARW
jgi:hypothetical protein